MAEEKKKLSVAEMMAAARAQKAAAAGDAPAEKPAEAAAPATPAAEKPAPAKPAGGKLSVAEMMAAARAQKAGAAAGEAPVEAPKAEEPKPAPKPVEKAKPAPKEKEPAIATAEMDTDSILAGGHKKDKPGPMSKAEAAAKDPGGVATKAAKPKPVVPPMPVKPAYAQPKPAKAGVEERRGFMVAAGVIFSAMLGNAMGVAFTAMSVTFGLWSLALARFMFPNVLREPPSKFKVGFISDFPFGKVEEKYKAQYGVWVVNYDYNGQREVYALSTVCTHLGCTPNWLESEQKFKCPCHGSGFYKDGINFEGPAPRPLERYAIKIADDGQLEVDKSRKFQEEMGQWDDPNSFVIT